MKQSRKRKQESNLLDSEHRQLKPCLPKHLNTKDLSNLHKNSSSNNKRGCFQNNKTELKKDKKVFTRNISKSRSNKQQDSLAFEQKSELRSEVSKLVKNASSAAIIDKECVDTDTAFYSCTEEDSSSAAESSPEQHWKPVEGYIKPGKTNRKLYAMIN